MATDDKRPDPTQRFRDLATRQGRERRRDAVRGPSPGSEGAVTRELKGAVCAAHGRVSCPACG